MKKNNPQPQGKSFKNITEEILIAYHEGGQSSAFDVANKYNVPYEYCKGCETDSPSLLGSCLICGQATTSADNKLTEQALQYSPLWRDDDGFIAQGSGDNYITFADTNVNDDDIDDRERRTDLLISAFNNTYGQGIDPNQYPQLKKQRDELLEAMRLLISDYGNDTTESIEKAKAAIENF